MVPMRVSQFPRALSTCVYSVEQMRDLLLAYGAKNSRALRERWRIRLAAVTGPPRCARYVPFFGFVLSTCPLGCSRVGGRQRVAGALSHVSSRAFATAPLSSHPSDEFPLSSLPFGPKTLVDVPFLSAGCDFVEISKGKKRLQIDFF